MKEKEKNIYLKPILKFNEVQENINKAIADMTYFTSMNSHDIIDYETGEEYPTSYALDIYNYDDVKQRLDDLSQLNGLRIFANNIYKEMEEALNIISRVVKCRFLSNLLSLSYEMLFCSAFDNKKGFNRNRFDNYDFTFESEKFDNKVVKLINSRINFDFVKLLWHDKEETERIVKILLEKDLDKKYKEKKKDLNKNYKSDETVNRCIHLFISQTDNEKNIVFEQANLMKSYEKLKKISCENNLDDYTFELKVKNQTIKAIVLVYVCP